MGESSAGKSTIGRIVLGLERPDTGEVLFDRTDLARLSARQLRRVRRRMHMVLQDPYESLHPGMRLARIVAEPLAIARVPRAELPAKVRSALDEVGLVPPSGFVRRYPSELSGGSASASPSPGPWSVVRNSSSPTSPPRCRTPPCARGVLD